MLTGSSQTVWELQNHEWILSLHSSTSTGSIHLLLSHKRNDFSDQELTYIWELLSDKSLFPSLPSSQNINLYWCSNVTQSHSNASSTYGQFYKSTRFLLRQYHIMHRCIKFIKCSQTHGINWAEYRKRIKHGSNSLIGFWLLLKGQVFRSMRDCPLGSTKT